MNTTLYVALAVDAVLIFTGLGVAYLNYRARMHDQDKQTERALGEYRCIIKELVAENGKVFAKMLFTGIHRGRFMGVAPTQRRVSWHGCALFSFDGDLIGDVWVLGDLQLLKAQMHAAVEDSVSNNSAN